MDPIGQSENISKRRRVLLIKQLILFEQLRQVEQEIIQCDYDMNKLWASQFQQPPPENSPDTLQDGDDYDNDECPLRARKTKKTHKGLNKNNSDKRSTRHVHCSKKRGKEARAQKKSLKSCERTHNQLL